MKCIVKTAMLGMALGIGTMIAAPGAFAADSIYAPNLSYRKGPFAATGIPLMNGQRDYILMLNERDGGVNGVMIDYDECETSYSTEKGVECYQSTKERSVVTQPWSTGITLQVLPKTNIDEIPILAPGYGFSPMSNGKVFQWAFNPPASYWDGASMLLNHVSGGDMASLKGKKIALLHLDHPYGKEPIPLFEAMAEKHGYTFLPIPVGLKEMQNQSAQWLQIRRERPDFVFMWGWGAMNAGAITEAVKTKYPMDQFIGIWWSGHDGDLNTVGDKGKGYKTITWSVPVPDAPVIADIEKHIIGPGNSLLEDPADVSTVFYQRGVLISMILTEGIRSAQEHFDAKVIDAKQLRWGLENLKIDDARLAELGMTGMIGPFSTSCADHTGHAGAWILQWDGAKFVKASDKLSADRDAIAPLEQEKADEYAKANAPWPINEACKM